jgi:hypothetical protein
MSRFWIGVTAVFLIGLAAIFSAAGQETQVTVRDLETECRYDRAEDTGIELNPDNSLSFQGYFPVENTNSNLNYRYSSGNDIVLNVRSQNLASPADFWNNCLASAVYDIDSPSLEQGTYSVTVKHNGERVEKRIISIRN